MIFLDELPSPFHFSKATKQLNLQAITVWVSRQTFLIQPNLMRSRIPTVLQIKRKEKTIKEYQSRKPSEKAKPHYFSCLVGIIDLRGKKIIVLAEQVNLVGSISQRDIFKITKPVYLFYDPSEKETVTDIQATLLLNVTALLQQGMYFSFSYDLALSLNCYHKSEEEKRKFNWASELQIQLQTFDPMWRLSIIQGFVGRIQLQTNGLKLQILLISRRARNRGGVQYFTRGIDPNGNVGNFVQTQQIVKIKDSYFSFLQCRGTVPVFWRQQLSSYGFSTVKFDKNQEQNYIALKNHLSLIRNRGSYERIALLNLLNSQNQEKKLIQNYQYLVRKLLRDPKNKQDIRTEVKYAFFDLHQNCPAKNYTKFNDFLQKNIDSLIQSAKFSAIRIDNILKKIQVLQTQTCIIRTNCYSCIDRSNIAQSRIAAMKVMSALNFMQVQISQFKNGLAFMGKDTPFSNLYRNLWADNADQLSRQYTGTGSTQSLAQRKGKLSYLTTLDHGMKSLFRAVRNIRNSDQNKNLAIQFITGQNIQGQQKDAIEMQQKTTKQDFPLMAESRGQQYNYKKLSEITQERESMDTDGYKN